MTSFTKLGLFLIGLTDMTNSWGQSQNTRLKDCVKLFMMSYGYLKLSQYISNYGSRLSSSAHQIDIDWPAIPPAQRTKAYFDYYCARTKKVISFFPGLITFLISINLAAASMDKGEKAISETMSAYIPHYCLKMALNPLTKIMATLFLWEKLEQFKNVLVNKLK